MRVFPIAAMLDVVCSVFLRSIELPGSCVLRRIVILCGVRVGGYRTGGPDPGGAFEVLTLALV